MVTERMGARGRRERVGGNCTVMKGDLPLGGERTAQHTERVTMCYRAVYLSHTVLLANVTLIHLIKHTQF